MTSSRARATTPRRWHASRQPAARPRSSKVSSCIFCRSITVSVESRRPWSQAGCGLQDREFHEMRVMENDRLLCPPAGFAAKGDFESMVTYSTAQGYKPDYLYLMQRMMMDNPEAAVSLPFHYDAAPSMPCPWRVRTPAKARCHASFVRSPC